MQHNNNTITLDTTTQMEYVEQQTKYKLILKALN